MPDRLTSWDHKIKPPQPLMPHIDHLPASYKYHQISRKTNPCLITKTEYNLPYFIFKFKIKCLPNSWLSIAFSDTDLIE